MYAKNPYLPSWEYIPDGEPYVFDGRLYIYGSHDKFNSELFCVNDYVCWSAPVDEPGNWRYEGVIYRRNQDPQNQDGHMVLYAPDVTVGPDGRYYFIYSSVWMYELCYATSKNPMKGFQFGGVIISNNDRNIDAYKPAEKPMYYGGNNHGKSNEHTKILCR